MKGGDNKTIKSAGFEVTDPKLFVTGIGERFVLAMEFLKPTDRAYLQDGEWLYLVRFAACGSATLEELAWTGVRMAAILDAVDGADKGC